MALSLVAAACGDDDDDGAEDATTEPAGSDAAPATTAATDATEGTTAATSEGSAPDDTSATTEGDGGASASGVVAPGGDGSADLGAFKLGVINSNDLFPDYSGGIEAAVEYANAELNGLEGRDIEVQVCTIDYNTPDDTQRCANELAAAQVDFVISTLNQFGTHMQILRGAGIPVLVGAAVSVPDYTTEGVYAVSPGGGCAGTLTAEVKYAVQELGARRLAVPYYDIPSGVLCYADSEQKPIDVLKGTEEGSSPDAGSVPDLERVGVPVPPTDPDLTSVANQILEFNPDAIIFSGPATVVLPAARGVEQRGLLRRGDPVRHVDVVLRPDGGHGRRGERRRRVLRRLRRATSLVIPPTSRAPRPRRPRCTRRRRRSTGSTPSSSPAASPSRASPW